MTVPLRRRGTRAEALSGGVLHVVTPTLWYRTPEGVQGIKEVDRARLVRGTPYGHSSHCIGSCECNHDLPRRVSQERGTSWAAPGLGWGSGLAGRGIFALKALDQSRLTPRAEL